MAKRKQEPQIMQQYGVRWKPDGPVFAFASRDLAESALQKDGRGAGVLVVSEGISHRPQAEWTPWTAVSD